MWEIIMHCERVATRSGGTRLRAMVCFCESYFPPRFRKKRFSPTDYSLKKTVAVDPDEWGPLDEYDERVHSHKLRDDEHQRGM